MKTAFLFSGQGAQTPGMGKELYDNFTAARDVFDRADEALGFSISKLCFEGGDNLNLTEYTQPAILTHSAAALAVMRERGFGCDVVAGLSLGEYSALYAAGAFDFETAVRTVRQRGKFMSEATPPGFGAMCAIFGLTAAQVEAACEEANTADDGEAAYPANYNAPDQIVIAGTARGVDRAVEKCNEIGAKRAIPLKVSAPFHTPFLQPAADNMQTLLETIAVADMRLPVITNVTADIIPSVEAIKPLLVRQVSNPVRWTESVERLVSLGVDTVVELGPGKTLCGFVKKVSRDITLCNVEDLASFDKTLMALSAFAAD